MDTLKRILLFSCALTALTATTASAQPAVNLTGAYRCVQGCPGFGGMAAFVTHNGWNINIVTETGIPLRAWFDWYGPTTRIWMDSLNQGAVFSPDGMIIQFDSGTVWQRDLGQLIGPDVVDVSYCTRRYRSYDLSSRTYRGSDGRRHPCP